MRKKRDTCRIQTDFFFFWTNERTMKYSRVKCRWHNYEQSSRKGKRQKKVKNEDGRARKCIIEQHQRDTNRKEEMGRRRPREMLLDVAACCGWVERRRRKVAFFFFFLREREIRHHCGGVSRRMSSATNQRDGSILFSSWLFLNRPNCWCKLRFCCRRWVHTHKKKVSIS